MDWFHLILRPDLLIPTPNTWVRARWWNHCLLSTQRFFFPQPPWFIISFAVSDLLSEPRILGAHLLLQRSFVCCGGPEAGLGLCPHRHARARSNHQPRWAAWQETQTLKTVPRLQVLFLPCSDAGVPHGLAVVAGFRYGKIIYCVQPYQLSPFNTGCCCVCRQWLVPDDLQRSADCLFHLPERADLHLLQPLLTSFISYVNLIIFI